MSTSRTSNGPSWTARLLSHVHDRATRQWLKAIGAARVELETLAALLVCTGLCLIFAVVANEMSAGDTRTFDNTVILSMRDPVNRADPIGPRWFEEGVRDITSLGGNTVLVIVTLGSAGFLALSGARHASTLLLLATGGGAILVQVLKDLFGRVRPDVVSHSVLELTRSFPSGHATMAAVTYLTLGALLARVQPRRTLKMYVLGMAIFLTILVGVSRVYLGMHFPTDVLAGWCLGSAWALGCWLLMVRLQRQGQVERTTRG